MKDRDEHIADLIVAWEDSVERGRAIELEELCRDHPELVSELRQAIDKLRRMQWLTQAAGSEPMCFDKPASLTGSVLVNRYRVEELIGSGGFGNVYRGFDEKLQRPVAIKVGRQERHASEESLVEEARKAAKLRHPNLVTIHDVVVDAANAFIVCDIIEGPTLSRVNKLSIARAIDIVSQVADAVDFAHQSGVIHCDIKPDNILLCPDGRPVLADFGIARLSKDSSNKVFGTAAYMAPELLADGEFAPTERSDVWSLGVVLHELLYGDLPSEKAPNRKSSSSTDQPEVPRQLMEIVSYCLEPDPAKRTKSARELADKLRSFSQEASKSSIRRNLVGLIGAVLPVILLLVALSFWQSQTTTPKADLEQQAPIDGMYFDGETKIVTPLVRFAPCTIEAWVQPSTDDATCAFIGCDSEGEYGLGLGLHQGRLYVELLSFSSHPVVSIRSGRWTHIAACYDVHETRLYVDGRLVSREMPTMMFGETAFAIGALSPVDTRFQLQGHIRSVRISSNVRYRDDFSPTEALTSDGDSRLVYDLTKRDGEIIEDLSGNNNHGSILRAKPFTPEVKQKPYTFAFQGGTAISTPVERFAPSTLEAWIVPFANGNPCSFVFGSDVQSQYGLGLAICAGCLNAEYMNGMINSQAPVPLNQWSHVAVVFGESETSLFLNGAKVKTGPATAISGNERFVVGRLSESQLRDEFFGQIRTLRISKGERYIENFVPTLNFEPDDQALVIYQGDKVDGTRIIDLSGNRNHGEFIGKPD